MDQQDFIFKSISIHNNKYNYSLVVYKNIRTCVTIICPIHGEFKQKPLLHLRGSGCQKCGLKLISSNQMISKEDFIVKARNIHGNKYDYSKLRYDGYNNKGIIICPIHGEFEQFLTNHLKGSGCKKCSIENITISNDKFLSRSLEKHGNKYDYSLVNLYNGVHSKVTIICPVHGKFKQLAISHMSGFGCKHCSNDKLKGYNVTISKDEFLSRALKKYGDKYDYSLVNEIDPHKKLRIICKKHGIFEQFHGQHLKYGCQKCSYEETSIKNADTVDDFIYKSNIIHNNKYDYSKFVYKNCFSKSIIICPIHGEFTQVVKYHSRGCGCPKCALSNISRPHKLILDYIKSIYNGEIIINDRKLIGPYEIDIAIPENKIGIEIDGLYYHSYHKKETKSQIMKHNLKQNMVNKIGWRLLQFFEDEIMFKHDIVLSEINHAFNLTNKINVDDCELVKLTSKEFNCFCNKNDLYGRSFFNIRYGLIKDNEIVCIAGFNKCKDSYECKFCSKLNVSISNGINKLLTNFISEYKPKFVTSYIDKRYQTSNELIILGFELLKTINPNCFYVDNYNRFKLKKQFNKKLESFNPNLPVYQNMFNNKYRRIWDSGHEKYLLAC